MYSEKENFIRTMRGEAPDHLIAQWAPFIPVMNDPVQKFTRGNRARGKTSIDRWGTTIVWPEEQPAAMPHITPETKVLTDITKWREQIKVPDLAANCTDWEEAKASIAAIDKEQYFSMCFMGTGIFEQLHYLMGFEDTLMNLIEEPECMDELIEAIFQYRYTYAKLLIDNLHPDAILSHDDWGAKDRMFMRPDVWRNFFKERYYKFYKLFRDNNVISIHHADSFCEPITGDMIDVCIDVWQGVLPQNNIVKLQKEFGGRILFMGGIDSALVDKGDASEEARRAEVRRACEEYVPGGSFIPCLPSGLRNGAIFPNVDDTIDDEIRKISPKYFKY
jgi:uroporphyrinogen-III decarboxylase